MKFPPTYVFLSIVAPPATCRATEASARDVASSVLLTTKLPDISASLLRSKLPVNSVLPCTLAPPPTAKFLAIPAPPVTLTPPSAAYEPARV